MKKKKFFNLIFVLLIVCILTAGVLGAGFIRGWFDAPSGEQATLSSTRGVAELLRDGVRFTVSENTPLRAGDVLTCREGASVQIQAGDSLLALGENAEVTFVDAHRDSLQLQVASGEVFVHCESSLTLAFESDTVTLSQTTALLSVQGGTQSIRVFRGSIKNASAGQILCYNDGTATTQTLALSSLNDFTITQIRQLNNDSLCFTVADLDQLAAERRQTIQEQINEQEQTEATSGQPASNTSTQAISPTTSVTATEPTDPVPSSKATDPTVSTQPSVPESTTEPTQAAVTHSCTIAIYCRTILNNMGSLDSAKAEFVPSDGVILYPVTVEFTEGETVFDILKRVCSRAGIQLEYSWTPMYNSYYIEGIHQLYEFDCGYESGWMYQVNGWYPNYGCSSYTVKDGDVIVWNYTCQGLGADL